MSEISDNVEWFLARDGQQHGPLSDSELHKFMELGHLRAEDLVWRAGFDEWRPATDVFPQLADASGAAQPADGAEDGDASLFSRMRASPPSAEELERLEELRRLEELQRTASAKFDPTQRTTALERQDDPTVRIHKPSDTANTSRHYSAYGSTSGHVPPENTQGHAAAPTGEPVSGDLRNSEPTSSVVTSAAERWEKIEQKPEHSAPQPGSPEAIRAAQRRAKPALGPLVQSPPRAEQSPSVASTPAAAFRPPAPTPSVAGNYGPQAMPPQGYAPAGYDPAYQNNQAGYYGPPGYAPAHGPEGYAPQPFAAPPMGMQIPEPPRRFPIGLVALIVLIPIVGAGGWLAYENQDKVLAYYEQVVGEPKTKPAIVLAPPDEGEDVRSGLTQREELESSTASIAKTDPPRQPAIPRVTGDTKFDRVAALSPAASKANKPPVKPAPPDDYAPVQLMRTDAWRKIKSAFPDWASSRIQQVRQLTDAKKSEAEITKYLVGSFIELRRDNAALALSASPDKLESIAAAFVDNLKALAEVSPATCYAFISRGEASAAVLAMFEDPLRSQLLNNQTKAIVEAIIDAKASPHKHRSPDKADFDLLSTELTKSGWTQADLQMFSDPAALSRAEPATVCRLVTQWFVTQTRLPDPEVRSRLIAASLRPVIAG